MPVYEYKCSECSTKFEVLHKSTTVQHEVTCPSCSSAKNQKLFSSFSSLNGSSAEQSVGNCATGNCGVVQNNCASGMCGLN